MNLKNKFKKIKINKKIYKILHYKIIFKKKDYIIFRELKIKRIRRCSLHSIRSYYKIYLLSSNICIYNNRVLYESLGVGEKILSILNQLIEKQDCEEIRQILYIRDWLKEQQL